MLVNGTNITAYKAELLDRAISTTVVHSITDWLDEATEGSLLRQSYDWRNIKLTFLIREIDEDKAYKRISALTEALKDCVLRFDDIELDFPCVLDGTTVPERLQNGVFKVIFNLKNDWAVGEPISLQFHVATANAKRIHIDFIRNWTPTMESYTSCFEPDEIYEKLGSEDLYVDMALVEELAEKNQSWSEFFLELGVPVNKYKNPNDLNGFLNIETAYSPEEAKKILEDRDTFIIYYNRFHKDGYNDFPTGKTYPSLVWQAKKGNKYYFDTGVGKGWNIQDVTVSIIGRYFALTAGSNGAMFGAYDEPYSLTQHADDAHYAVGGPNDYSEKVFESDDSQSQGLVIGTLEDVSSLPLREYGIKSSKDGSAPVAGYADFIFNGITLTRGNCANYTLNSDLTIALGRNLGDASTELGQNLDIARVRIYHKGELVQDLIPIAGNLKNCFINDYDIGFYDIKSMKFVWWRASGQESRHPDEDLMRIPGMPDIPTPPPAPDTFAVTVVNGTGSGNYEENAIVTIKANDPGNDMMFDKWVYSAPITLDYSDDTDPNSFRMITQEVTITATFKEKPIEIKPEWLLYSDTSNMNEETSRTLGSLAKSWSEETRAGLEFTVAFSVPNASITGVTYYPSGTSSKTLKLLSSGRDNFGRAYYVLQSNGMVSISGCYISGKYNGQTYTQDFNIRSLL